ncbi:MAG: hypothetical protein GX491_10570 [Chloroflexi bacterium]|nr:hypothetical protein [Chloroflexota bacterium]
MKNVTRELYLATAKLNAPKVRVVLFALTLTLFAIAAGAPEAGPGFIR